MRETPQDLNTIVLDSPLVTASDKIGHQAIFCCQSKKEHAHGTDIIRQVCTELRFTNIKVVAN
jgi:hypothetical protein